MSKVNPLVPSDVYVTTILSDGELLDGVTFIESSPEGGRAFADRFNSRPEPTNSKAVVVRVPLTEEQRQRIERALTGRRTKDESKPRGERYYRLSIVHPDGSEEITDPCAPRNSAKAFVKFFNSANENARSGRKAVAREINVGSIKLLH